MRAVLLGGPADGREVVEASHPAIVWSVPERVPAVSGLAVSGRVPRMLRERRVLYRRWRVACPFPVPGWDQVVDEFDLRYFPTTDPWWAATVWVDDDRKRDLERQFERVNPFLKHLAVLYFDRDSIALDWTLAGLLPEVERLAAMTRPGWEDRG